MSMTLPGQEGYNCLLPNGRGVGFMKRNSKQATSEYHADEKVTNESTVLHLTADMSNLDDQQKQDLLDLIRLSNVPKSKKKTDRWYPTYGSEYWWYNAYDLVFGAKWESSNDDREHWTRGVCFKTREECEEAIEVRKYLVAYERFARDHNAYIDWEDADQPKFSLIYNYTTRRVDVCKSYEVRHQGVYFSSDAIAKAAIGNFTAEKIKRYILRVQEPVDTIVEGV